MDEVSVVILPAGVIEVPSGVATVASHSVSGSAQGQIDALDLSPLPAEEQVNVRSLLEKYTSCLCMMAISHEIPLLDDVTVLQRNRHISPSDYEVVNEQINNLSPM